MADEIQAQRNNTIDMVIVGRNDTFKKDYNFRELNLAIHLVVKFPNVRIRAKIEALRSDILLGTQQSGYTNRYYETLFLIQEAGQETTVFVTDDSGKEIAEMKDYFSVDGYSREDVTLAIADDVLVWMDRFRG